MKLNYVLIFLVVLVLALIAYCFLIGGNNAETVNTAIINDTIDNMDTEQSHNLDAVDDSLSGIEDSISLQQHSVDIISGYNNQQREYYQIIRKQLEQLDIDSRQLREAIDNLERAAEHNARAQKQIEKLINQGNSSGPEEKRSPAGIKRNNRQTEPPDPQPAGTE